MLLLLVVFGLYPIVMRLIMRCPGTGVVGDWSPSGAMLLATLVTCSVLAVVVMPVVTRAMGFWLYPAYRDAQWKADVLGLLVMCFGLVCMVGIFDRL